ncbi:hypothetical protein [Kitasatospora indigofera]|uniref:hypothetical protein n=1 Tax=Kitasatospora indigofera TaxID=67307 RepID=UPI0036A832B5
MEDPQFTVLLTGTSPGGPEALRAVGEVTGLSLWHSKLLLGGAPATVRTDEPFADAAAAARRLRRAGVPAAVRCTWCERTLTDDTPVDPGPCTSLYWPTPTAGPTPSPPATASTAPPTARSPATPPGTTAVPAERGRPDRAQQAGCRRASAGDRAPPCRPGPQWRARSGACRVIGAPGN